MNPHSYFICQSGARSMNAAISTLAAAAEANRTLACFNVAEGFEGNLYTAKHRGKVNGWKAQGLPWRQS